jgi:hypothetical protein
MDTAAYDEAMRDHYRPGIIQILPDRVPVLKMFEDASDQATWSGRAVVSSIEVGRNEGSGWGSEMGSIPAAGKEAYTTKRVPMRYQYGRTNYSEQVLAQTQGEKAAFSPAFEQGQKSLVKGMAIERGRAIFGDGRGILAYQNGAESGATLTVDAPAGVAGAINGNKHLRPNRVIAIINPATGAIRSSAVHTIATRAAAGTSITTVGSVASAAADNDYVVSANSTAVTDAADTNFNKELMGLNGMIDDGTYVSTFHNVNRTTYPLYGATVISNAGAWSADLIQRAIDVAQMRGDGQITDLLMEPSTRRAYITSTEDQRRYIGADLSRPDSGTAAAKGGQLAFGSIPITEDKFCHYGVVYGIDMRNAGFKRYVMKPGEWIEQSGSPMLMLGTGSTLQHGYECVYTIWDNFDCDKPNVNFRIDGITVNAAIVPVD